MSGTFISLFVAFFELITKLFLKQQNSDKTVHKKNSIDNYINQILDDVSNSEFEKILQRILQQRINRYKTSNGQTNL